MSVITIAKDIWTMLSSGSFVYMVVNEFHTLKAAKAAGTSTKTLLAEALAWIKGLFTSTKPAA